MDAKRDIIKSRALCNPSSITRLRRVRASSGTRTRRPPPTSTIVTPRCHTDHSTSTMRVLTPKRKWSRKLRANHLSKRDLGAQGSHIGMKKWTTRLGLISLADEARRQRNRHQSQLRCITSQSLTVTSLNPIINLKTPTTSWKTKSSRRKMRRRDGSVNSSFGMTKRRLKTSTRSLISTQLTHIQSNIRRMRLGVVCRRGGRHSHSQMTKFTTSPRTIAKSWMMLRAQRGATRSTAASQAEVPIS